MSTEGRINQAPNLALGIIILAIGVALTLDRLHVLEASRILRFWPVGLILLGAGVIAQSFSRGAGEPGTDRRHRVAVTPMFVLAVIVVGFLVGPRLERRRSFAQSDARDTVTLFAIMSADERSSFATKFQGGEMTSVMGASKLDLRQATIAPGEEAVIDVFAMMGGVELRVPDGWTVDVQAVSIMGGVKDQRLSANTRGRLDRDRRLDGERPPAEAGPGETGPGETGATNVKASEINPATAPRVVLRGFIMMGGLVIKS